MTQQGDYQRALSKAKAPPTQAATPAPAILPIAPLVLDEPAAEEVLTAAPPAAAPVELALAVVMPVPVTAGVEAAPEAAGDAVPPMGAVDWPSI